MVSDAEHVLGRSQSWENGPDEVTVLNERRRIALEKIDNAHFSYDDTSCLFPPIHLSPAGSMRRYASLQVPASLPMRKSIHSHPWDILNPL